MNKKNLNSTNLEKDTKKSKKIALNDDTYVDKNVESEIIDIDLDVVQEEHEKDALILDEEIITTDQNNEIDKIDNIDENTNLNNIEERNEEENL
jgi:uncharacterized protein YifN (PemK superfamily)